VPRLVIMSGPRAGEELHFSHQLRVGRVDADLEVADAHLSRRHAAIGPAPSGGLQIRDLGSANGTFVNGHPVTGPVRLVDGDEIVLGATVARLEGVTPEAAPPPPAPPPPPPQRPAAPPPPPPAPPPPPPQRPAAPPPPPPAPPPPAPAHPGDIGPFAPPRAPRRRTAATRQSAATVVVFAAIAIDALALVVYFAAR
jgi:hypothetical protein